MTRLEAPAERDAWIALASVTGIGDELLALLVSEFRSARNVLSGTVEGATQAWNIERAKITGRVPLGEPTMRDLEKTAAQPSTKLGEIESHGLWTYTSLDADYPARLRDLDPPPAVIHGLGDKTTLIRARQVAIVGTRRPTPAGRALAARVASRLVECGAIVVSGLAIGIDGAAHAAVVDRAAPTVGVIGAGHRQPGPRAHEALRDAILASGGALISEHHPSVGATKGTYPRRNRIIAALGDATIVIEAPRRSGALITAARALELGRPVFVAPGRVGDWSVAGSLALLRETPARPLVGLDELIEDLGYLGPAPDGATAAAEGTPTVGDSATAALEMLGPSQRTVAQRLRIGPAGLDVLVADTGLPPGVVSSAVTMLQMRGWAQSLGPAYVASGPLAR